MTTIVRRNGVVLCVATVPYSWGVIAEMLEAGCTVAIDGKRVSKAQAAAGVKGGVKKK